MISKKEKRINLYKKLSDNYSEDKIGTLHEFMDAISQKELAIKIHNRLIDDGFSVKDIGYQNIFVEEYSDSFFENIIGKIRRTIKKILKWLKNY